VRGADPIIKLLDESKNVVETLGIDKWNTDSVEAFFDERLKKLRWLMYIQGRLIEFCSLKTKITIFFFSLKTF
jgi:hypothetical protein